MAGFNITQKIMGAIRSKKVRVWKEDRTLCEKCKQEFETKKARTVVQALVETAGVEPASEKQSQVTSTCLVCC